MFFRLFRRTEFEFFWWNMLSFPWMIYVSYHVKQLFMNKMVENHSIHYEFIRLGRRTRHQGSHKSLSNEMQE